MTECFTESTVEEADLAWLESVGWQVRNAIEIAPGEPAAERDDYGQVMLELLLRDALARLNPALPAEALDDAFRKLTRPEGTDLIVRSRALHRLLVNAVTGEYCDAERNSRDTQPRLTPSAQVIQAFEKLARPLHERIVQCARESRTLTTLRDKLLPKLISGELQVKDTERIIEVTA